MDLFLGGPSPFRENTPLYGGSGKEKGGLSKPFSRKQPSYSRRRDLRSLFRTSEKKGAYEFFIWRKKGAARPTVLYLKKGSISLTKKGKSTPAPKVRATSPGKREGRD